MFPSNGISYSEVCSRVVGYQYGTTLTLITLMVSVTQGYPRKHIWSLIAGSYQSLEYSWNSPCNTPPGTQSSPLFVDDDYFCESGNPNNYWSYVLYTADPLWDGEGCGAQEGDCCAAVGLPWFYRTLNTTTDNIELRDCGSFTAVNENVFISSYEIYVK